MRCTICSLPPSTPVVMTERFVPAETLTTLTGRMSSVLLLLLMPLVTTPAILYPAAQAT